jgi:long-chain acyl-CoA synthetase
MPLVRLMQKHRPSSFPAVPTLWAAIVSNPAITAEALSCIEIASSGGAPLPAWVQERFRSLTGRRIYEAYGLSEATGATHFTPYPEGGPPGTIGKPLAGLQVRLVDPETGERDVAVGEVGELLVKGSTVMAGYFQNAELTARVLRGGWLHTGDLLRRDADGFYFVVDRKDDLILTSGYNVYPSEVEAVLLGHPAVKEAAVVGMPDRLRGAVVVAHVVQKPGSSVRSDELLQLCRDNLPDYKVPRSLVFTEALPKNPAGKTLRKTLREAV